MKKILVALLFLPFIGFSQAPILLDTVGNACHINIVGFAKDGMTYSLYGDSSLNITIQGTTNNFSNAHYSRFRDPNGSSFANRQALTNWLDTYFFADAAASGSDTSSGGGSATLQEVTDNGNTSSNSIIVTGSDNFSTTTNGIQIINGFGVIGINPSNPITPLQNSLSFTNGSTVVQFQGKNSIAIREPDPGDNVAPVSVEGQGGDLIRIRAAPATQSQDLITLEQFQVIGFQNIGDLNNSDTLTTSIYYIFLGSNPASFTLPDPNGNSGRRIYFINDSVAPVTMLSYGGGNTISDSGVKQNTGPIVAGQTRILVCNGIYWYFVT